MSIAEHTPTSHHETTAKVQDNEPGIAPHPDVNGSIGSLKDYEHVYSPGKARLARLGDAVWGITMKDVLSDTAPKNHPDDRGL
jgi:hypothetical protein